MEQLAEVPDLKSEASALSYVIERPEEQMSSSSFVNSNIIPFHVLPSSASEPHFLSNGAL